MSEFIGSRISLISKSDIRYVGTLVEINSEASTVSLDNVRSFGTEGRKGGNDEYPPSDTVYEQIVFRGSDVKDLRIEEPVKEKASPAMPQDPAIIGVQQSQSRQESAPQDITGRGQHQQPPFPQHGQFPPGGYPPFGGPGGPYGNQFGPPSGFPPGRGPFPGGPGGPPGAFGMPPPFGAPPGWFPPGQGFHQPPGPFSPNMPIGPPGLQNQNQNQPPQGARGPAPGPQAGKDEKGPVQQPKVAEADGAAAKPSQPRASAKASGPVPTPAGVAKQQPPPPPVDSKPDVAAALAPPHSQGTRQPAGGLKPTPSGPKGGRIVPAVPIPSPRAAKAAPQPQQPAAMPTQQPTAAQQQNATQLATAAVAEAMAKLNLQRGAQGQAQVHPLVQAPVSDPFNNLAQKVGEMRDQQSRQPQPRQRGTGEFRGRGGRGGRGGAHPQHPKMEVPTTDFDFESSNAKFNKQDLIKEAIASGSPLGDQSTAPTVEPSSTEKEEVVIPSGTMYDKSSFFDNISSELKDREEAAARGQEFRSQERHKNMETFGQGSVDGYRGRGRGRGGRGRGRGFGGYRGRGAPRGRGGAEFGAQPAA